MGGFRWRWRDLVGLGSRKRAEKGDIAPKKKAARPAHPRRTQLYFEALEDRTLLASPQLVSIVPNVGDLLLEGEVRTVPFRELTFRFSEGQTIDPTSLEAGIVITRDGPDGAFNTTDDIPVPLGYIGTGQQAGVRSSEVVARFAEPMVNDRYQIRFVSSVLRNTTSPVPEYFDDAETDPDPDLVRTFTLDLGPMVTSVVPQPVSRDPSTGALSQAANQIVVFFNDDDLVDTPANAENPNFYRLIWTNGTLTTTDDVERFPTSAVYEPASDSAILTFSGPLDTLPGVGPGIFRLRIGTDEVVPGAVTPFVPALDPGSSLASAEILPALTANGHVVSEIVVNQPMLPLAGGDNSPGHRDIPLDGEMHGGGGGGGGVSSYFFNSTIPYGSDPQGNPLFNQITETQKQRVREIFELFSFYTGLEFIETAFGGTHVIVGDIRVLLPTAPTGPGGVAGIAGGGMAIMDAAENWGTSEYGGFFFTTAMHEIGHTLGLGHTYELQPVNVMGDQGSPGGEPIFPGDNDILHLATNYAPDGVDIDLYRFDVAAAGRLTAEVVAQRLATPSHLDGVLTLFDDTGRVIARNDDYFNNDSFLDLHLNPGRYYVGVTSVGNTDYDPNLVDSGFNGRTSGAYDLVLKLATDPVNFITDVDAQATALDGDADGLAGGVHNFWFDVGPTLYVDKLIGDRLTVVSPANIDDGDRFTISNGTQPARTFEFNSSGAVIPGNVAILFNVAQTAAVVASNIAAAINLAGLDRVIAVPNGTTVTIHGLASAPTATGSLDATEVTFTAATGSLANPFPRISEGLAAAAQRIVAAPGSALVDGQTFRLDDGVNAPVTFEFDTGGAVLNGNVAVDYTPADAATTIAASIEAAITAAGGFLFATPSVSGSVVTVIGPAIDVAGTPALVLAPNILRIVGNAGTDSTWDTLNDNLPYLLGQDFLGSTLADGAQMLVPQGVSVVFDAGAIVKLRQANIDLGTSQVGIDRSGGSLAVLGTPAVSVVALPDMATGWVRFTSYHEAGVGGDDEIFSPAPGDWGGLVFRPDSDHEEVGTFRNHVGYADLRYGGGTVVVESVAQVFTPVHLDDARPTVAFNRITRSADAAVSADPDSFEETLFAGYERVGPDIHHNLVIERDAAGNVVPGSANTIAGLSVRVNTPFGGGTEEMEVNGRWDDVDIVHVITENLFVRGNPGGLDDRSGLLQARLDGRLAIDPGIIVKLGGSRIEVEMGGKLLAEGSPGNEIIFTSVKDDRYGAGGTFDTDSTDNLVLILNPALLADAAGLTLGDGTRTVTFEFDNNSSVAAGNVAVPFTLADTAAQVAISLLGAINAQAAAGNLAVTARLRGAGVELRGLGALVTTTASASALRIVNPAPEQTPASGDWGGIFFAPTSKGSIADAVVLYGGGTNAIEGGFATFNPIEIHQAEVRITDSTFQENQGLTAGSRNGRGGSANTIIFVRGAQPILVNNVIHNFGSASAISINANAMQDRRVSDVGRARQPMVDAARLSEFVQSYTQFAENRGPMVRENRIGNDTTGGTNGMVVRGAVLTTATVWDDTDVVHVLLDEIQDWNFHGVGGLRLQSSPTQSLVVKLSGPTAGFTATGTPLEIDDRIGGTVQVLGTPGHPVILTALTDDTVGAGLNPEGLPDFDTNNNGAATNPIPGAWRSIKIDALANDRNVRTTNELESPFGSTADVNGVPNSAEFLGDLATGEKGGDDNLPLGFEARGFIALDNTADVDVYSFTAMAGTEVWLDIDRTDQRLDAVLDLINAGGTVLARSTDQLPADDPDTTAIESDDPATSLVEYGLAKDLSLLGGRDFYTTNTLQTLPLTTRDPGMRLVLPGAAGTRSTYYVRVRSAGTTPADPSLPGLTRGAYQLQVRLRQVDEFPGSTVRYADIRFATNAVEILGQPAHSPLVGETGEALAADGSEANQTFGAAQSVGNLLASDRNTISIAGNLASGTDVDWYRFVVDYQYIQSIGGVNSGGKTWATIFDLDWADALGRADTTLSVFDDTGRLVFVSRDSNVRDDQPLVGEGNDLDDLLRGSAGVLDPFIGNVQLPEATGRTFYVAVSSNSQAPAALQSLFTGDAATGLVRLEPINSVTRVIEDHIGLSGYVSSTQNVTVTVSPTGGNLFDIGTATQLGTHVRPFELRDVTLFVGTGTRLWTYDPFSGAFETDVGGTSTYGDVAMRSDGRLMAFANGGSDAASGILNEINTGTGGVLTNIGDFSSQANPAVATNFEALAYQRLSNTASYSLYAVSSTNELWRIDPTNAQALLGNSTTLQTVAPFQPIATMILGAVTINTVTGTTIAGLITTDMNTADDIIRITPSAGGPAVTWEFDAGHVILAPAGSAVTGGGANTFFRVTGPSGSAEFELDTNGLDDAPSGPIDILINITAAMTSTQVATAIENAIESAGIGLIVARTSPSDDRIQLVDSATGLVYTGAAPFIAGTPLTLIERPGAVGGNTAILYRFDDTAAQIATRTAAALDAHPSLVAPPPTGSSFSLSGAGNIVNLDPFTSTAAEFLTGMTFVGSTLYGVTTTGELLSINTSNGFTTSIANFTSLTDLGGSAESESNDTIPSADLSGLASNQRRVITGTIASPDGGVTADYDYFSVTASAGQRITVDVDAQILGSTLDSYVAIYDGFGSVLATNDDSGGPDSFLNFTPALAGTYLVAVMASGTQFQGDPFDSLTGLPPTSEGFYSVRISRGLGSPVVFNSLTTGPQNVQNFSGVPGAYANMLFAAGNNGRLYAFNTAGTPQVIFDSNNDGIPDASDISLTTGVRGLAFSPLDFNLWHPTVRRSTDAGHGISNAPDLSRDGTSSRDPDGPALSHAEEVGGVSLWFGLEQVTSSLLNYGTGGQYGNNTNSQADLANNATILNTYNLPGGGYGSLETHGFSLAGYSPNDLPTLYFNYFLDTQGASSTATGMRDSARVFITRNGGQTWEMLATNNSSRDYDITSSPDSELPGFASASRFADIADPRQRIQELYDAVSWRQARIDLSDYAGESDLMLRFDFSTAGSITGTNGGRPLTSFGQPVGGALPGDQFGDLSGTTSSNQRGQNNQFEGFYIDDIIIGFAERGEMATGTTGLSTYFTVPQDPDAFAATQILVGPYQLEIRRGTEYGFNDPILATSPSIFVGATYDPNDRFTNEVSLAVSSAAVDGLDGQTFTVSDGRDRTVFEFDQATMSSSYASTDVPVFIPDLSTVVSTLTITDAGTITDLDVLLDITHTWDSDLDVFLIAPDATRVALFTAVGGSGDNFTATVLDDEAATSIAAGVAPFSSKFSPEGTLSALDGMSITGVWTLEITDTFGGDTGILNSWSLGFSVAVAGSVGAGNVPVPFGLGDTAAQIAAAVRDAINTAPLLDVTADVSSGNSDRVHLVGATSASVPNSNQALPTVQIVREPNETRFQATPTGLVAGTAKRISQSIDSRGGTSGIVADYDFYSLSASALQTITVDVDAQSLGSSLDAVVALYDSAGALVATAGNPSDDDGGSLDSFLSHTVVSAGTYYVAVYGFGTNPLAVGAPGSMGPYEVTIGLDFDPGIRIIDRSFIGDTNLPRDQGMILVERNVIRNAFQSGIRVVAGTRDPLGSGDDVPHPGSVRNTPTLNTGRLAPGVSIENNVVAGAGASGILFAGDPANSDRGQPPAPVPFGRIINNTIYGAATPAGIGIDVANYASPTLLNNILASLATGIRVDATSGGTVVGTSLYHSNGTNISGASQSFALDETGNPLFINAATGNFYLVAGSRAIDASLNSLVDRPAMVVVTDDLGIPQSPILAPVADVFGQRRVDDPFVPNLSGLGINIFVDRGAVERTDYTGPSVRLITPEDNDAAGLDTNPTLTNVLVRPPYVFGAIAIQFLDQSGIDDTTVAWTQFTVTRDGVPLQGYNFANPADPGNPSVADYLFSYDAVNDIAYIVPAGGVFSAATYVVTIDNTSPNGVRDLAGNYLLPNQPSGGVPTFTITYGANDPPRNTVPGPQTTDRDVPVVFSAATANAISISDPEIDTAAERAGVLVEVSLSATNGTMTLSGTAGLVFSTGDGTADASMLFTGTVDAVNAALEGMVFTPTLGFTGTASLVISTSDLGYEPLADGAQSDTDTVTINVVVPVNDPPVNTVPGLQTTDQDVARIFSSAFLNAISIADPEINTPAELSSVVVQVTLTATNGTVTLSGTTGLSFSFADGNGTGAGDGTDDATMAFRGTVNDINAALNGLSFQPTLAFLGMATLDITTSDLAYDPPPIVETDMDTITINVVMPVNDAPILLDTLVTLADVAEDAGVPVGAVGTLISAIADLTAPAGGQDNVVELDPGPVVTGSAVIGASTTDGAWFFTIDGGTVWTPLGAVSATSARLLAADASTRIQFQPNANFNGSITAALTFRAWDQTAGANGDAGVSTVPNGGMTAFSSATDTASLTVTPVNDAPVNTVPGPQATTEDSAIVFSSAAGNAISIADLDAGTAIVGVTLTGTSGTITLPATTGLSFAIGDGADDATMTFTGTIADVNTALNGLSFLPAVNFEGAASLAITTDDLGNTGAVGPLAATDVITITVSGVNDPPVNGLPATQGTATNTALVLSAATGNPISVSDPDAGAATVQVTFIASAGLWTLGNPALVSFSFPPDANGAPAGDGTADAVMTFRGTIANINLALDGSSFLPNTGFEGTAQIQMTTNDLGNSPSGPLSDTDILLISVINPRTTTIGVYEPASNDWFLTFTGGSVDIGPFQITGLAAGAMRAVAADWDGDGIDEVALYNRSLATWALRDQNTTGAATPAAFIYGEANVSLPIAGDWDGDGLDTIGVYDAALGKWSLRNSNAPGAPDVDFNFGGGTGTLPVVGDWNGDGIDTIGFFDPATRQWTLRNSNSAGPVDIGPFTYGLSSWIPVAGDWNGDGVDAIGLFDALTGVWHLRNSNSPGSDDQVFGFNPPGTSSAQPVAGIWLDVLPPIADIVDISPDPRNSPAGVVTINFNENVTGLDISDFTLTRDASPIDVSTATVITVTPRRYTIDLAAFTAPAGTYVLTLSALGSGIMDGAGNAMANNAGDSWVTDATAPVAPAILALTTDSGSSSSDRITTDQTLVFSGTAEPASTVTITRVGVGVVGTAVANGVGNWSFDYTATTLAEGLHDFTATATDPAGNTSPSSPVFGVTVDRTAPVPPVLAAVSADTGASTTDRITNDPTLLLSGTTEALATVTITRVGVGVIGTATADGAGAWSFDYTATALADGTHNFTVRATDLAGNAGADSANVGVTVDLTSPAAPSITGITNDTGTSSTDRITNDPTLFLTGTAEAQATVTITRVGVGVIGSATADGTGYWTFDYTATVLAEGTHNFTATATDLAGNPSVSSPAVPVVVDLTAPVAPVPPTITAINADTGASGTDRITSDPTLIFSGVAEAFSAVELTRVGVGVLGTATVDGAGNWSFDYTATTLVEGTHSFIVTATDLAGNTSPASSNLDVTVDQTPPAAPVITSILNDTGSSSSDRITNDQTLLLVGTAEPGITVTLSRLGVGTIGTTTADGLGNWNFSYTGTVLPAGSHTFTASAADVAGNTSTSADFLVTVDLTQPTADVVDVSPDPRATAAGLVTINTSEAVSGVDLGDFSLTRDGSPVSLAGLTVNQVSPSQYTINLSTVTGTSGRYVLTLTAAGITDLAGNLAAANASDTWDLVVLGVPTLTGPSGTIQSTGPTFTWTAVAAADHYDLWVDDATAGVVQIFRARHVRTTSWTRPQALEVGHTYRWWVRAGDAAGGTGAWSAASVFNVQVAAPTPVGPTSQTADTTPTFTWNSVPGASRYEIWVDDLTTGATAVLRDANIPGTSFTPTTGLATRRDYRWWVRAFGLDNNVGPWSAARDFRVDGALPFGTTFDESPTFTWDPIPGAVRYDVWVDNVTAGQSQIIRNSNISGASFNPFVPTGTAPTLTDGSTYRWWYRGFDAAGNPTAWSKAYLFTLVESTAPTPLAPLTRTIDTTPTFQWTELVGAAQYELFLTNVTRGTSQNFTNIAGASFTSSLLVGGDSYRWSVRGVAADGTPSGTSAEQQFVVDAATSAAAPTLIGPTGTTVDALPTFTWNTVAGASRYDIWVNDLTFGISQLIRNQNVAGTSFVPGTALTSGHTYRWWVRAITDNGVAAPWSASLDFLVSTGSVSLLTAPSGAGASATPVFTWTPLPGADRYDVWVDDVTPGQAKTQVIRDQRVAGTSYTSPVALISGRTYRWWVRAVTRSGAAGSWSNSVDFTVATANEGAVPVEPFEPASHPGSESLLEGQAEPASRRSVQGVDPWAVAEGGIDVRGHQLIDELIDEMADLRVEDGIHVEAQAAEGTQELVDTVWADPAPIEPWILTGGAPMLLGWLGSGRPGNQKTRRRGDAVTR